MTEAQKNFYQALINSKLALDEQLQALIEATGDLRSKIMTEDEYYDANFPPEILRMMDQFALSTGWLYMRLETAAKSRHNTQRKIKKALGYTYP